MHIRFRLLASGLLAYDVNLALAAIRLVEHINVPLLNAGLSSYFLAACLPYLLAIIGCTLAAGYFIAGLSWR